MPCGAVGISVNCKGMSNFALVGQIHELGGVLLLDETMREAGDSWGVDVVRIRGTNIGGVSIRVVEGNSELTAGTAVSGPEGGVGVVEVFKWIVRTAREELGDKVGRWIGADGSSNYRTKFGTTNGGWSWVCGG